MKFWALKDKITGTFVYEGLVPILYISREEARKAKFDDEKVVKVEVKEIK